MKIHKNQSREALNIGKINLTSQKMHTIEKWTNQQNDRGNYDHLKLVNSPNSGTQICFMYIAIYAMSLGIKLLIIEDSKLKEMKI